MAVKKKTLEQEFEEIQELLESIATITDDGDDEDFEFRSTPWVSIKPDEYGVGDDYNGEFDTFSRLEDAVNYVKDLLEASRKRTGMVVRGVDEMGEYDAKITEDGITVGCTTIPFDKFDEIVATVNEVRGAMKPVAVKKARKPAIR